LETTPYTEYCSGTIINSKFILTSAQCVFTKEDVERYKPISLPPQNVTVLFTDSNNQQIRLPVKNVQIHPEAVATLDNTIG